MENTFKTPSYQRKAYKDYVKRNEDNEEFREKRKKAQKEYYEKNKSRILQKLKEKRYYQKVTETLENINELEKEVEVEIENI